MTNGAPPSGPPGGPSMTEAQRSYPDITPGRTGGRIRLEAATTPITRLGIRALAATVSAVVADVAKSGRPAVVTKHGEPVAALIAISDLEDLLAARALRDAGASAGDGAGPVE